MSTTKIYSGKCWWFNDNSFYSENRASRRTKYTPIFTINRARRAQDPWRTNRSPRRLSSTAVPKCSRVSLPKVACVVPKVCPKSTQTVGGSREQSTCWHVRPGRLAMLECYFNKTTHHQPKSIQSLPKVVYVECVLARLNGGNVNARVREQDRLP